MNTENQTLEGYLLRYAFLATPYATLISVLYLWGYWSSFKVNIFSYIALSDILKLAVVPLLLTIITPVAAYIPTFFFYSWVSSSYHLSSVPPARLLFSVRLVFAVGLILILVFTQGSSRWFLLGTWFAAVGFTLISRFVIGVGISKELFQHPYVLFAIALLIIAPLCLSFGFGRSRAEVIFSGTPQTQFVDTKLFREFENQSFIKKELLTGQDKLKFVGIANDYLFFLSLDNSKVYITKFSDVHFLRLQSY